MVYPDTVTKALALDEGGNVDGPAVAVTADAEGRFAVPLNEKALFFVVIAQAAGFAPAFRDWVRAGDEVTVTHERPGALVGHVMDAQA